MTQMCSLRCLAGGLLAANESGFPTRCASASSTSQPNSLTHPVGAGAFPCIRACVSASKHRSSVSSAFNTGGDRQPRGSKDLINQRAATHLFQFPLPLPFLPLLLNLPLLALQSSQRRQRLAGHGCICRHAACPWLLTALREGEGVGDGHKSGASGRDMSGCKAHEWVGGKHRVGVRGTENRREASSSRLVDEVTLPAWMHRHTAGR